MELDKLIVSTLKEEVTPAMGCTEPVAVALACAKAKEIIKYKRIDRVNVYVSPNVYKNGLSVGIPNTDMAGLYIAAALGIAAGKSQKDLRVLEDIKNKDVEAAKNIIKNKKLFLHIKDTNEKIYVEVNIFTDQGVANVIIKGKHNCFAYLEVNGEVLLKKESINTQDTKLKDILYNASIKNIIETIEKISFKDLDFLLEGLVMNEKIAQAGLQEKKGMGVGFGLYNSITKGILSDDLMNNAMMLTSAASDARMSGLNLPVMSSNGSGNNGLTTILPILAYQKKYNTNKEKIAKALAISHIINSYIKHYIYRLSALCSCGVAAGTAVAVALAWLMGANLKQIEGTIKNMLGNTSGMICDGAKVGCALKLATSASAAVQSALLAVNDSIIPSKNGIIGITVEETIKNLGILSKEGMSMTDDVILEIMRGMEVKSIS